MRYVYPMVGEWVTQRGVTVWGLLTYTTGIGHGVTTVTPAGNRVTRGPWHRSTCLEAVACGHSGTHCQQQHPCNVSIPITYSISQEICTRFLLCCALLCLYIDWFSHMNQANDCPSASKATLMNMDKYFMWIHYERLHNHNKAKHNKTVCICFGIYCMNTNGTTGAKQCTFHCLISNDIAQIEMALYSLITHHLIMITCISYEIMFIISLPKLINIAQNWLFKFRVV